MDFDGDGNLDILSGCYWSDFFDETTSDGNPQAGYTLMLRGKGDLDFEAAVPLRDADGEPLTNVKLTKDKIENYDSKTIVWQNICTAQHCIDYDGDGDFDIVNGCIRNEFFLHVNEADSPDSDPVFKNEGIELPIKSPDQHSDPHLADFDGDGDLDLLTGGSGGGVFLSLNSGSRETPKWESFECLVDAQQSFDPMGTTSSNAKPSRGSRVWTYDFNRDGKLDLLVGDSTEIVDPRPGTSAEEFAKEKAEFLKTHDQRSGYRKFYDERAEKFDVRKTGHIWLYLQK